MVCQKRTKNFVFVCARNSHASRLPSTTTVYRVFPTPACASWSTRMERKMSFRMPSTTHWFHVSRVVLFHASPLPAGFNVAFVYTPTSPHRVLLRSCRRPKTTQHSTPCLLVTLTFFTLLFTDAAPMLNDGLWKRRLRFRLQVQKVNRHNDIVAILFARIQCLVLIRMQKPNVLSHQSAV